MRVADIEREAEKRKKDIVRWYNPDIKDFKFKLDGKEYIWKATDFCNLPKYIAEHGEKHLIDLLIRKRGIKPFIPKNREKLRKEIRCES